MPPEQNQRLRAGYKGSYGFRLEHWHYDTFRARWRDPTTQPTFVTFALNAQGKVEELKLALPGLAAYPFKRSMGK